jgi:RimJ/RimL family protein N-acetyltransferase
MCLQLIIEAREPPAAGKGVRDASDAPDTDLFVGQVMLNAGVPKNRSVSIGIALEPRWWGQGLGTEAVRFALDYAFDELNVHRVGLDCQANNARAVGAYKRACVALSSVAWMWRADRFAAGLWKRAARARRSGRAVNGSTGSRWASSGASGKPRNRSNLGAHTVYFQERLL